MNASFVNAEYVQSAVLRYSHAERARLDVYSDGVQVLDFHLHSPLACDVCCHEHPRHADFL